METYRQLLKRLRRLSGLTQQQLGNIQGVNVTRARISQLEHGADNASADLTAALDAALNAGGALIAAREAQLRTRDEYGEDIMAIRRRNMLAALGGITAAAGFGSYAGLEALRQRSAVAAGIDRSADDWAALAAERARTYFATPAASVIDKVGAELLVLQEMIGAEPRSSVRSDLRRSEAQLMTLLGMALSSTGNRAEAHRWWDDAKTAATESNDTNTKQLATSWQLINRLYDPGVTAEQLHYAREDADTCLAFSSDRGATAGRAHLLSVAAQSYAMQGDAEGAAAALAELEDLTGDVAAYAQGEQANSVWAWPEVRFWHTKSYVHTYLGQTRPAWEAQDAAFSLYTDGLAVEATMVHLHRAACLAIDGDGAQGARYANDALEGLPVELYRRNLIRVATKAVEALPSSDRSSSEGEELTERISSGQAAIEA